MGSNKRYKLVLMTGFVLFALVKITQHSFATSWPAEAVICFLTGIASGLIISSATMLIRSALR